MITGILTNGVKTIIIEKLDRLARDLMIQEHIIQDLQRRGITTRIGGRARSLFR